MLHYLIPHVTSMPDSFFIFATPILCFSNMHHDTKWGVHKKPFLKIWISQHWLHMHVFLCVWPVFEYEISNHYWCYSWRIFKVSNKWNRYVCYTLIGLNSQGLQHEVSPKDILKTTDMSTTEKAIFQHLRQFPVITSTLTPCVVYCAIIGLGTFIVG